ncbi:thiamine-phosphate kinase [Halopseudomonas xinjiangensis]|uniref:Thiamine-monophosphate kinase n=2 Tax=Halopseudomonas xinjiangensis TaxID=487184 RepID=A0A1H1WMI3_9GAMM|nr:thiamine-phosphate kinase [Halopseudomonas xinjiangensis]SDS97811.1 thiamine-phosphate kinase [Halopseudomonas xinjiangensis]
MPMGEFELVRRFFRSKALEQAGDRQMVALGIGDDAALLNVRPGYRSVISTDSMVESVHFPSDYISADLGYRALAVAASDLAAMAARPVAFTLALTLPRTDEAWLEGFSRGLACAAGDLRMSLIGGDTTRGPLNIGVTVFGEVASGAEMRRDGAHPGDLLCISGPLGDGAAGLAVVTGQDLPAGLTEADRDYLRRRFWSPQVHWEFGLELAKVASAGLDVSDGLLADAGHLAEESGVGLQIRLADLPLSSALGCWPAAQRDAWMLSGGDDYVLLFTLPRASEPQLNVWRAAGWPVTVIGRVVGGEGVWLDRGDGLETYSGAPGYQHFGGCSV